MLFEHEAVSIGQNTGHQLVPDWDDLENPVKILIDVGNDGTIDDTIFVKNQATDVKANYFTGVPGEFNLYQNYPNPFNPSTTITFDIPAQELIVLKIYNILGQEIATLVNEVRTAGHYSEIFNASQLPSGVYIYKLTAGSFTESRKMILLR